MEKMMLNLNSLAMMVCTCDFYRDNEVALTTEEWLDVEKKFKNTWFKWTK